MEGEVWQAGGVGALEDENAELKQLLAEAMLDNRKIWRSPKSERLWFICVEFMR